MARQTTKRHSGRKRRFVVVNNQSYGKNLRGIRIYYEGKKPGGLSNDGKIRFGKNILELLKRKYSKFHWIITEDVDSVSLDRGIYRIRTSARLLGNLYSRLFDRTRDIKNDLIKHAFASVYPAEFSAGDISVYVPGTLAGILSKEAIPKLSGEDKEKLTKFLPDFISSESIASVNLLKAKAQIQSLKELVVDLEIALADTHSESWWQTYIRGKILIIQQGYIKALEKMNVAVGQTKFPDFALVTHDSYLDILEIKKPTTGLLKFDSGRGNFYWDAEMSKAIIQVENYIADVSTHANAVRSYLLDKHKITLQVLRPRGIIIAGDRRAFKSQKETDDFPLLSQALKNISLLTYDELLVRLQNYIQVLEEFKCEAIAEDSTV
jgi:Domain of unknown function (DUF4263)